MSLLDDIKLFASESVGMGTDFIKGTRNLTKTYESGTRILLNHTEYYQEVHTKYHAEKQTALTKEVSKLPADVKKLLAQFKQS